MTVIVKNGGVLLQSFCMQIRDLKAAANDYLVFDTSRTGFTGMLLRNGCTDCSTTPRNATHTGTHLDVSADLCLLSGNLLPNCVLVIRTFLKSCN